MKPFLLPLQGLSGGPGKHRRLNPALEIAAVGWGVPFWSQPRAFRGLRPSRASQHLPRRPPPDHPSPSDHPMTGLLPDIAAPDLSSETGVGPAAWLALRFQQLSQQRFNERCGRCGKPGLGHPGSRVTACRKHGCHRRSFIWCQGASAALPPCQVLRKPWKSSLSALCHSIILL